MARQGKGKSLSLSHMALEASVDLFSLHNFFLGNCNIRDTRAKNGRVVDYFFV